MTQPRMVPVPGDEILGYIRVSTGAQAKKFSPASQKDVITLVAESHGRKISDWLEDHETGTKIVKRDGFQEIQRRVEAGRVCAVYVNFVDRFARNTEDTRRVVRQFMERGVEVVFCDMPGVDLKTPDGMFMLTNYANFAEFEHAKIKQRSMLNRARKIRDGKIDAWRLPYGFVIVNGHPMIDKRRADVVRKIFRLRDEGKSIYEIAGILHADGDPTPRGKVWRASSLSKTDKKGGPRRGILHNRSYLGEHESGGKIWPVLDREGNLLTIVDSEVFSRVQLNMEEVAKANVGRPETREEHRHMLRGLLFCDDECEGRWIGNNVTYQGKLYRYYRCGKSAQKENPHMERRCLHRRRNADEIENKTFSATWALLKDPARVYALAVAFAADEAAKLAKNAKNDPRKELQAAQGEVNKILQMVQRDMMPMDEGESKVKALRVRIARLEVEARAISKVVEIAPLNVVERVCAAFTEGDEPTYPDNRRMVLDGLRDYRVTLRGDTAWVTGKIPMPDAAALAGAPARSQKNQTHELKSVFNTFEPIPFEIKVRLAA